MGEQSSSCCVVLVTTASVEDARAIAQTLVRQRLAACINILPIQSIYTWDGAVQEDNEWQLLIKTTSNRWAELKQTIQSLHPYEVPEIIGVPIEYGLDSYLSWIEAMTTPDYP